jgi:hydroxymethylpyrimidine pyrophosphatase-like HAD family hydrolase
VWHYCRLDILPEPRGLQPILDELGLQSSWFIAYQGALIGRWTNHKTIAIPRGTCIDDQTAQCIEQLALDSGLSVGRYTGLEWRVPVLDSAILREAGITGERPLVSRTPRSRRSDPHKLMAITAHDDLLQPLEQLFYALPSNVGAAYSHHNMLEITAAGVNKSSGITALAAELDGAIVALSLVAAIHAAHEWMAAVSP